MKNIFEYSIDELEEMLRKLDRNQPIEDFDLTGIEKLGVFKSRVTPRYAIQVVLEKKKKEFKPLVQYEVKNDFIHLRKEKITQLREISKKLTALNDKMDTIIEMIRLLTKEVKS